jgi:HPt (histidine-containing phosphotransfer) domain-containing protein
MNAMNTMNIQILNWPQTLEKYRGDEKIARELMALFFKELPATQQAINTAFEEKNLKNISDTLHRLKGSCCFISVPALQNIVNNFYQAARSCTPDKLNNLQDLLDNFNHEVSALMIYQKEFQPHEPT